MCSSIKTTLACGHTFINHTARCSLSKSRFCTPDTRHQYLDDTCADCDPEAQRRRVKNDYEARHAELMAQYIAAKRMGEGPATMAKLERLAMENTNTARARNFEVGLLRREADVMWWEAYDE